MIDDEAGEIAPVRSSPRTEAIVDWVRSLPEPAVVAYEAVPAGFGLARALLAAGVRVTTDRRAQGAITRTGNSRARWLLVEAAGHPRGPHRPGRDLLRRRPGQSAAVRDRAERGNRRLHRRRTRLDARGSAPRSAPSPASRLVPGASP